MTVPSDWFGNQKTSPTPYRCGISFVGDLTAFASHFFDVGLGEGSANGGESCRTEIKKKYSRLRGFIISKLNTFLIH